MQETSPVTIYAAHDEISTRVSFVPLTNAGLRLHNIFSVKGLEWYCKVGLYSQSPFGHCVPLLMCSDFCLYLQTTHWCPQTNHSLSSFTTYVIKKAMLGTDFQDDKYINKQLWCVCVTVSCVQRSLKEKLERPTTDSVAGAPHDMCDTPAAALIVVHFDTLHDIKVQLSLPVPIFVPDALCLSYLLI